MPTKLTVGTSKKLGLPAYSSVGASCQMELELDARLIDRDPAVVHEEIRQAYRICRAAVEEELQSYAPRANGEDHAGPDGPNAHPGNGTCRTLPRRNGHAVVPASARQVEFLRILAARTPGVSPAVLELLCTKLHGTALAELSARNASALIETLQEIQAGQLALEHLLDGADRD
jgi:hypothetical protein